MSMIKKFLFKTYIGIQEQGLEAEKINIFKGPKGCGKSSIIEALETSFTHSKRRTEVIKHGEEEAILYVELDNGLEITRRIRDNKADYLKIRKGEEGVPNTEKFLEGFINGNIFRPIDWVNLSAKEQTKSILNMLEIEWSQEDIRNWFGEIPSNIEFNQHILMVLKAIETKYYHDRAETNKKIDELRTQVQVIKKDMPIDYDGEIWRDKNVQEYYKKVSEAQEINKWINEANSLQENIKSKIEAIEANSDSEKSRVQMKYKDQRQDIKDILEMSKNKIEKSNEIIKGLEPLLTAGIQIIKSDEATASSDLEKELQSKIDELKAEYKDRILLVSSKSNEKYELLKKEIQTSKENEKETIQLQETKIATKQQELISLDEIENQAIEAVKVKKETEIEKEQLKVSKSAECLEEHTLVNVEPLQSEADVVATMREYLHQWDNMIDIRDNKLSEKEREAQVLTARIEKARTLPSELLKTAQMPIEGISVDEKGYIRIKDTLIDGLSEGEKFELAMQIAKAQCGELKIICLDGMEKVKSESKKIFEEALTDEYQYFITIHTDDEEFSVEKLGGSN